MKELFLVTTASEDTWPEPNKPVLFLGEWCRLYSRKDYWKKIVSKTVLYHWDDRDKLYKDYQYLLELYEVLLAELTIELNKIHGVSYTIRYWRIVIGPWLLMFLPVIFDRWSCIHVAIDRYSVTNTNILEEIDLSYVPVSMEHFTNIVGTDLWNHAVYSSILKFINYEKIVFIKKPVNIPEWQKKENKVKKNLISKIKDLSLFFSTNKNYFFYATYLKKFDVSKLQLKLGQIPVFYQERFFYQERYSSRFSPQDYFRGITLSGFEPNNAFERYAKEIIPLQIPTVYLEGYKSLSERTEKIRWPINPKLIWTSNAYFMDEVFKVWAAKKVDNGVPLVIGQHGGHYGQGLFNTSEYHELKICDYYLSWGWGGEDGQIVPVGTIKQPIKINKKNDTILFIISGIGRYSDGLISMPLSSQWIDYFDDQMKFYENLPEHISGNVLIRLYPHDYEWSQRERWKDRFPNSEIDECEIGFNKVIKNTKLFISGWNSTTYLESLHSNVPTIIFWKPKYFEMRSDTKEIFDDLRKANILHDDPVSAAKHLVNIYNNIDMWWNAPDVIFARKKFTEKYVYSNNLVNSLGSVLTDIYHQRESLDVDGRD